MPEPDLAQVVAAVTAAVGESKRYRHVAPSLVSRLAAEELPKARNAADAEKRTKRRLHQIFGAYATPVPYDKLITRLDAIQGDAAVFKKVCAQILTQHASTAERINDLEAGFYEQIFEVTGKPSRVLDLACGFNPLTIPWMGLNPRTFYTAADIDAEMVRFLDRFLALAPVHGEARLIDLVENVPATAADVAFVFKTLPCLRHQTDDLALILAKIRAPWLVVSFPTRSLGNRAKGMTETYRAMFAELAEGQPWQPREILFPSELVYVIKK
jgi:16S rRNA (guanine(1405)-N(7))-methyltransferase